MKVEFKFCPQCAAPLAWIDAEEDGGTKSRLRCGVCGFTHWNNPTPVLAAVVECVDRGGQVLLARNAAWSGRMFALITGFMEAGETAEEGIAREVAEETSLVAEAVKLASAMVAIGKHAGRKAVALISDMNQPLGHGSRHRLPPSGSQPFFAAWAGAAEAAMSSSAISGARTLRVKASPSLVGGSWSSRPARQSPAPV